MEEGYAAVYLYGNRVIDKWLGDCVFILANDEQTHHQKEKSTANLPFFFPTKKVSKYVLTLPKAICWSHNLIIICYSREFVLIGLYDPVLPL